MRYKLLIFICLLCTMRYSAFALSYIYIQGDKQVPFYVKFEGEMQPRYGKNYSIISQLAPGPVHLQILFQQNTYPAQEFTLNIPENGERGFLLIKKGDAFSLYDVSQKFYLPAGNTLEDDHLPETEVSNVAVEEPIIQKPIAKTPIKKTSAKPVKQAHAKPVPKPKAIAKAPVKKNGSMGPQFINDIELDNVHTVQAGGDGKVHKTPVAIINSDCPKAVDNDAFDRIREKAVDKSDENRIAYLLDQTDKCFTTYQVRQLSNTLKTDAEKFTFLKDIYSRVTDQAMFPSLEDELSTEEWKGYFRNILPKH